MGKAVNISFRLGTGPTGLFLAKICCSQLLEKGGKVDRALAPLNSWVDRRVNFGTGGQLPKRKLQVNLLKHPPTELAKMQEQRLIFLPAVPAHGRDQLS